MEIGFLSRHRVNPLVPVNFLIHYIENVNRGSEGGEQERKKKTEQEKRESFLILDLEGRTREACNSY